MTDNTQTCSNMESLKISSSEEKQPAVHRPRPKRMPYRIQPWQIFAGEQFQVDRQRAVSIFGARTLSSRAEEATLEHARSLHETLTQYTLDTSCAKYEKGRPPREVTLICRGGTRIRWRSGSLLDFYSDSERQNKEEIWG